MTAAAVVAPPSPPRRDEARGGPVSWQLVPTAAQMVLVAGLAAVATSGWARLGEGSGTALAVALGSAAPPALALGASAVRRRRWPAAIAVVGHMGLVYLLAVVVAGGSGAAGRAMTGGWARLLSTILPAPAGSEVEVLALLVSGAASAAGAELALRGRSTATPALPAVLALVTTRMASQGVAESRLTGAAAGLVLVAAALALVRAGAQRPAVGVVVALVAALVAAAVAPGLPWAESRPPFDPRALRHLAPVEAGAVNPLARLQAWQANPDRVLFHARLPEPATMRLAVLDRYDGARFTSSPRFSPVGAALPPPPPTDPGAGAPTRTITAEVVIDALDGPWVPAPDRATRVSGPPVAVDPLTGVVVAPAGVQKGQRYQVVSAVATDRQARLSGAVPASAEQVGPGVAVPPAGLPETLADQASEVAGDPNDDAVIRLKRLEELFQKGFRLDPASAPGHSLARLLAFLDPADRVGSTEQMATAFAVLARSLGYPTRVAVGFRPSGRGEVAVRGADAEAWPEVAFAGVGWVAFDPVPSRGAAPGPQRRPPEAEAATTPATVSPLVALPPRPPTEPAVPRETPRGRPWLPAVTVGGAALVVVALVLGAIAGSKRRRRRRRRGAAEPGARVRGAWAEAVDRLVEHGLGRPLSRTPRDAAASVVALSGSAAPPLADLGELAERAAFAGPGAVIGADADRAWADLDLLEAALAAQDSRLATVRCALDPRPLASRS